MGVSEAEEDIELLAEGAMQALAGAVELEGSEGGVREAGEIDGAGAALADHRVGGELPGDRLDLGPSEPPGCGALLLAEDGFGAVGNAGLGGAELQVVGPAAPAAQGYPVPAEHLKVGEGNEGNREDDGGGGETYGQGKMHSRKRGKGRGR